MKLLATVQKGIEARQSVEMSLSEYLDLAKKDPSVYATPAARLLKAIGEPKLIDTAKDHRLSRIFQNRIIKVYDAFLDFYGIEDTISEIVGFLKHADQGLEESKQILYLLGAPGTSKSGFVKRLKQLMEQEPFYAIKGSPVFESPLALFDKDKHGDALQDEYGIPKHRLLYTMSPWLVKRLKEDSDLSKIVVVKLFPSVDKQVAISRTEPGDENTQDIASLVGKTDIRKLERFSQHDADAYSFSGGLNLANRGMMEFVEMFKAPPKLLNPLLSATQDRIYMGTEAIGAIPFEGLIVAHSNEAEFDTFKSNKFNEAILDRITLIKVRYVLRKSDEIKIYQKLIRESELNRSVMAPQTVELLAEFTVMSRLKDVANSTLETKMKVYDGESLKEKDPSAKSIQEYKDAAGVTEGMSGISTRFAFKVLSQTFNYDTVEVAANPVHMMLVLENSIVNGEFSDDDKTKLLGILHKYVKPKYIDKLGKMIQTAYLESYVEYGQNYFDRYFTYADFWIQEQDYRDPETGLVMDRTALDKELKKIEDVAGIVNFKDFRNEVVNFCLRYRDKNGGVNPPWTSYNKIKEVIEKLLFISADEVLPQISFGAKRTDEDESRHQAFVKRMMELGHTESQVKLLVGFYVRSRVS